MASYPMIGALGIICCAVALGTLSLPAAARAATTTTPISMKSQHLHIDVSVPPASTQSVIPMGTATRPDGATLTVDGVSLLRDGRRWLATMGEFHYSRYPQAEWRDELLTMKAGGIEIVASYIFWIHHEEIENQWDFTGRRDLRKFVQLCGELRIPLVVRCGPWGHGEVRNGAFPEWLLAKNLNLRSDDPKYLDEAHDLYAQIAKQLDGLLWKDGGPVIGVQLDNEYPGAAQHLLTLKKMARDVGLDTPIYTRTGWPELTTKMPFGEILPLHGGYAEGFWDREITPMPGKYWEEFTFKPGHGNAAIATEQLGQRDPKFDPDDLRYPYLTCELGGGMMSSYHRRVKIDPRDIVAVAIVKVGTGSNLPGYYMYHGGTNPPGNRTTLNEAQATKYTNHNDLPVKTYDFQAPLGEFGQVRPHYHLLRRLHLFLHDFGSKLAPMPAFLPTSRPADRSDAETVRWAVRSDGDGGFVFVNNYQRLRPMPAKSGVRFEVKTRGGTFTVPDEPVTVPADETFYWPFNLDLGGAKLIYATAEPICRVEEDGQACIIFAETPGMAAEFVFSASTRRLASE
jgi:beta-galactosidase